MVSKLATLSKIELLKAYKLLLNFMLHWNASYELLY
jgi:hypothetical protein